MRFQKGPTKETDVNGIFVEDLLLIVLTRLQDTRNRNMPAERTHAQSRKSRKLSCGSGKGQTTARLPANTEQARYSKRSISK